MSSKSCFRVGRIGRRVVRNRRTIDAALWNSGEIRISERYELFSLGRIVFSKSSDQPNTVFLKLVDEALVPNAIECLLDVENFFLPSPVCPDSWLPSQIPSASSTIEWRNSSPGNRIVISTSSVLRWSRRRCCMKRTRSYDMVKRRLIGRRLTSLENGLLVFGIMITVVF